MIFTDDPARNFDQFANTDFSRRDDNLGIQYEKDEIFEDTVLLLRYNCPDNSCDVACLGWPDLHRHVKSKHGKVMWYVLPSIQAVVYTGSVMLNGVGDAVIYVHETKRSSPTSTNSSPWRSCASTKSTETMSRVPSTRAVFGVTQSVVSVVSGSMATTNYILTVVTDMSDATSVTDVQIGRAHV